MVQIQGGLRPHFRHDLGAGAKPHQSRYPLPQKFLNGFVKISQVTLVVVGGGVRTPKLRWPATTLSAVGLYSRAVIDERESIAVLTNERSEAFTEQTLLTSSEH